MDLIEEGLWIDGSLPGMNKKFRALVMAGRI
jgi:hypothetical protein